MTALQICNSALIKLGAKTISALTGLTTKEYDLCVERYPRLRNALLKSHVWAFAKVIDESMTSAANATTLVEIWDWKHTLPTTIPVGRILSVTTLDDIPIPFEVVAGYLYANEQSVRLRYTRTYTAVDDAAALPDDFGEALSNLLAADICVSLTQNQGMKDGLLQAYQSSLATARFNGAIETYPVQGASDDWLMAHAGMTGDLDPTYKGLTGY